MTSDNEKNALRDKELSYL